MGPLKSRDEGAKNSSYLQSPVTALPHSGRRLEVSPVRLLKQRVSELEDSSKVEGTVRSLKIGRCVKIYKQNAEAPCPKPPYAHTAPRILAARLIPSKQKYGTIYWGGGLNSLSPKTQRYTDIRDFAR